MSRFDDTIAALATAAEPAARAVVRVAGPDVKVAVRSCFTPDDTETWETATVARRHAGMLRVSGLDDPIEAAVWLWPTARSYCGQPTAEIHLLGCPPLVEALLEELGRAGVRAADRGEFTLRAVLAGRLDLMQAEAVLGVIDAADSETLTHALQQLGGGLSGPLGELRERLLCDLADLEAGLDFVEEDIEFVDRSELLQRLEAARLESDRLHAATGSRMRPPGPPKIVLVGPANAGKSTLLNRLVGHEAAVVSQVAGTTRDWVSAEGTIDEGRTRVEWIDTAGYLDELIDPVDIASAKLRDRVLEDAAVVLYCTPADEPIDDDREASVRALVGQDIGWIPVRTKTDIAAHPPRPGQVSVCAANESDDMSELLAAVTHAVRQAGGESAALLASTAARCRESLRLATEALAAAYELGAAGAGDELIAMELRRGLDELGRVLGRVDHEDVLDRLFARFCVGK